MTLHKLTICDHWHWLLWDGKLTHLPRRADVDYQAGDRIVFEGRGWREWTITHVLNSASMPGVAEGHVVFVEVRLCSPVFALDAPVRRVRRRNRALAQIAWGQG